MPQIYGTTAAAVVVKKITFTEVVRIMYCCCRPKNTCSANTRMLCHLSLRGVESSTHRNVTLKCGFVTFQALCLKTDAADFVADHPASRQFIYLPTTYRRPSRAASRRSAPTAPHRTFSAPLPGSTSPDTPTLRRRRKTSSPSRTSTSTPSCRSTP